MTLIFAFIFIFVVVFIVGCIEAVRINRKMKDNGESSDESFEDTTPNIIISERVPDPFESFRKKD